MVKRFRALDDPRSGHGLQRRAASTLACAALATLMGAGSYQGYEDVCKRLTRRQLRALRCHYDEKNDRHVAPSDSTFFRVLGLIDPARFEAIVAGWLLEQEIGQLERIAVDGKVLRGTGRGDGKPLALLSTVTHRLRTTARRANRRKEQRDSRPQACDALTSNHPHPQRPRVTNHASIAPARYPVSVAAAPVARRHARPTHSACEIWQTRTDRTSSGKTDEMALAL